MKTLYLDLRSGVSGDMFVAALLDLGVDFAKLAASLSALGVGGYHLHMTRGQKHRIGGTRFEVHLDSPGEDPKPGQEEHEPGQVAIHPSATEHAGAHPDHHDHGHAHLHGHAHGTQPHDLEAREHHHHEPDQGGSTAPARNFADIRSMLLASGLDPWVKEKAVAVFARLARAEGKVHGIPPEQVHFHEVGAVDSIVDIVGACVALDLLGRPRVWASAFTDGQGWVQCAHGRMPVPVPATLELIAERGAPLNQCEEPWELVTPTGAALVAELAERFGPFEGLRPIRVGYGLGMRDLHSRPNLLRAILAEPIGTSGNDDTHDEVAVLETNLDDCSPELLGGLMEHLLAEGAWDVFHTPVQMKKNRPGVLVTVLCPPERAEEFAHRLLVETSTFGVRQTVARRLKLRRDWISVDTPYGPIEVKEGWLGDRRVQQSPEFASCLQAARRHGVPLRRVYTAALRAIALLDPGAGAAPSESSAAVTRQSSGVSTNTTGRPTGW